MSQKILVAYASRSGSTAGVAEEIRKRMFTFENLVEIDGRSLQMILREINSDSLTYQ